MSKYARPSISEFFIDAAFRSLELPIDSISRGAVLGQGQFGVVYRGSMLGQRGSQAVALKFLKDGASAVEQAAFKQEAYRVYKMHHEHVVRLLAVHFETEPSFLAIELMVNGDVKSYLRFCSEQCHGRIRPVQLVRLCMDVTSGVAYLHSMEFVHRDLAARNVLLDSAFKAKIGDFGALTGGGDV